MLLSAGPPVIADISRGTPVAVTANSDSLEGQQTGAGVSWTRLLSTLSRSRGAAVMLSSDWDWASSFTGVQAAKLHAHTLSAAELPDVCRSVRCAAGMALQGDSSEVGVQVHTGSGCATSSACRWTAKANLSLTACPAQQQSLRAASGRQWGPAGCPQQVWQQTAATAAAGQNLCHVCQAGPGGAWRALAAGQLPCLKLADQGKRSPACCLPDGRA